MIVRLHEPVELLSEALRPHGAYLTEEVQAPSGATYVTLTLTGRESWLRLLDGATVIDATIEVNVDGQWQVGGGCTTDASQKRDRQGEIHPITTLRVRLPREAYPAPYLRIRLQGASQCTLSAALVFDDASLPPRPVQEHHSVTYDSDNEITGLAVTSVTIGAFAVGNNANRCMVVGVGAWDSSTTDSAVSTVSHNGSTTGWASVITALGPAPGINRASIWRKVAPAVVSATVVVTCAGTVSELGANALSAYGVDQTTPIAGAVSAESATVNETVNVTAATGDLVYDVCYAGVSSSTALTATVGASQDQRANIAIKANGTSKLVASTEPGAATVTMSWSLTPANSPEWIQCACALKQSTGVARFPIIPLPWRQERQKALRTALWFQGTQAIQRTTNLPLKTQHSVLCWVYIAASTGANQLFAELASATGDGYSLGYSQAQAALRASNGYDTVATTPLALNVWHHLAWTVSGGNGPQFLVYVNGTLQHTLTARDASVPTQLMIGNGIAGTGLNGYASGVRVYNNVLSAQEIGVEMGQYAPKRRTGLISSLLTIDDKNYIRDISDLFSQWTTIGSILIADGPLIRYRVPRKIATASGGKTGTDDQGLVILPSQMPWRASSPLISRLIMVTPSQMPWRTSLVSLTRTLLTVPSQAKWQAGELALGRVWAATPSRLQWAASRISVPLQVRAAQMVWQSQSLTQTRTGVVTPGSMQWQVQPPALGLSGSVTPARLQWQVHGLTVGRSLGVRPAQMQWVAGTGIATITAGEVILEIVPARLQWQGEAGQLQRALVVVGAGVQWRGQTPGLSRAFLLMPTMVQWQAGLLTVPRIVRVLPAHEGWQSHILPQSGILTVQAAQMQWQAQVSLRVRSYYPFRQYVWRRWRT